MTIFDYPFQALKVPAYPLNGACEIIFTNLTLDDWENLENQTPGYQIQQNYIVATILGAKMFEQAHSQQQSTATKNNNSFSPLKSLMQFNQAQIQPWTPGEVSSKSFTYLNCLGTSQNFETNGITDMFWYELVNKQTRDAACENYFGFLVQSNQSWMADTFGATIEAYKNYTNIIFINGLIDPTTAGSFKESLSDTFIVLNITNAAHTQDLFYPGYYDGESMTNTRGLETQYIIKWLTEAKIQKQNNNLSQINQTQNNFQQELLMK